jgi:hypothetical protein
VACKPRYRNDPWNYLGFEDLLSGLESDASTLLEFRSNE